MIPAAHPRPRHWWDAPLHVLSELWRRPAGVYALVVLGAVVLAALVSLVWTPHPLLEADTAVRLGAPSWRHPLGTDHIGRDTLSWLMAGARTTVVLVVGATTVAALVGITLATVSALLPPRWAEPVVVLVDILVAVPTLLIAMLLAALLGGSLGIVVVAVGFGSGVSTARILRPEIARVAQSDYVLASRAAGTGTVSRVVHHILPNAGPVAVVQLTGAASVTILAEAGLTFLGYGASPTTPSWGRSLANAQSLIGVAPLSVVWPGLTIAATVLALTQFGDALREALDPRLRRGHGGVAHAPDRVVPALAGSLPALAGSAPAEGVHPGSSLVEPRIAQTDGVPVVPRGSVPDPVKGPDRAGPGRPARSDPAPTSHFSPPPFSALPSRAPLPEVP